MVRSNRAWWPMVLPLLISCKPAGRLQSTQPSQPPPPSVAPAPAPLVPVSVRPAPVLDRARPQPVASPKKQECGQASFYAEEFAGSPTANGEIFDPSKLTAAHPSLPFGTRLRVAPKGANILPTDPVGTVDVVINDRGPFSGGRIIDLSRAAFAKLAPLGQGTLDVCLYVLN